MSTSKGQKLTYDYTKLDEHLSKWIGPDELDQYFRGFHTAFTTILQDLVSYDGTKDIAFLADQGQVRQLDEFFQILGQLKKEGGRS